MSEFKIDAHPENDVGLSIGKFEDHFFVGFDAVHDVAAGLKTKQRFLIRLEADDILWMIESLAKELPEVLHDEAVARIEGLAK